MTRMHQKEDEVVSDLHLPYEASSPSSTGAGKTNTGIVNDDAKTTEGYESNEASRGCLNEGVYVQKPYRQSSYNDAASTRYRHEYLEFENYEDRMNTFTRWPCSEIIEPVILVEAGFFYAGGLRNWNCDDGPWEEHARWFPGCMFLREHRGQQYINQIGEGHADNYDIDERSLGSDKGERYGPVSEPDIPEPNLIYWNSNYVLPEETIQFTIASLEAHNAEEKKVLEENRRLRELITCKICLDLEACIVFLPCGHLVSCLACACMLETCAVCRATIHGTVRTLTCDEF